MASSSLTLGTRGSDLALWQANHVSGLLRDQYSDLDIRIHVIETEGDQIPDAPLWSAGGKSFFTKEIDRALLEHEIDLAVHSLKDLETQNPPGIVIAAVPERANVSDALLSRSGKSIADLPLGSVVGTGSLRRRAFLLNLRPDLTVKSLRGNVPTRVQKLDSGEYDAIVLATAGLVRLGLKDKISSELPTDVFLPAVSQGALGICCRADDAGTRSLLEKLNDVSAASATTAERALLREIEGGCHAPLGARGLIEDNILTLEGKLCSISGETVLTVSESGFLNQADDIGRRAGQRLLEEGGRDLLTQIEREVEDLKHEQ